MSLVSLISYKIFTSVLALHSAGRHVLVSTLPVDVIQKKEGVLGAKMCKLRLKST